MQPITPFLWFDNTAEEAIRFYLSVFKNAKLIRERHAGPDGRFYSAEFEINGQRFMALNGGPQFTFNEAISLFVPCDNQQEVDELWEKLTEGGEGRACGWLKDKYGLSWQIIPAALGRMLGDKDREKSARVMKTMMQRTKLDIAALEQAYNG